MPPRVPQSDGQQSRKTRTLAKTTDRGYGREHQRYRAAMAVQVKAGHAICCRCRRPIAPDAEWHLDHNAARTGYLGPAHALCNLRAGGRLGAAITHSRHRRRPKPLPKW